jgi:hypothetical protein
MEAAVSQPDIATQRGAAAEAPPLAFMPQTGPTGGSETVFLTELTCEDRTFLFYRPLPVRIVQEGGGCSFESEEYNLLAYGHDRLEAESMFRYVFVACWDGIACKDDGFLTERAAKMKRALLSLVKSQR